MRTNKVIHVLSGALLLAQSHLAMAQAINFQPIDTNSIPALGSIGLVLLSVLMLAGALYFHRHAGGKGARLLSWMLGLVGLGVIASQHEPIRNAWAVPALQASFANGSSVVPLSQGQGVYEITNNAGSPIKITGFTGNGDSCGSIALGASGAKIHLASNSVHLAATAGSFWNICPHGAPDCPTNPLPGCVIDSVVPPSSTCYVSLECVNLLSAPQT